MGFIAARCPGCGAEIQLDDSRDFGFCNYCGTKVLQDKIVVEHKGNVKIDNSEYVEKFLQNARRAKQKEDWEETEKYYNLVEQNDPTNIEAIFYSSYGKAKQSLVDSDSYKRQAAFKVLQNCVSIVDDNFDMEHEEQQKAIIKQISSDIISMSGSSYVFNQRKNSYGTVTWTDKNVTQQLFINLNNEFCTTLEEIIKKYPENDRRITFYYELAIRHKATMLGLGLANPQLTQDAIQRYHERWHQIDPSHDIPAPVVLKKSGCYVATAVYGSYDCPQVWTLRRYRDDSLAGTWYGRAFIHTYYAISPTLVKWFGDTAWFKKLWQGKLDRMVKKLNAAGVEDTPYQDKEW